MGGWYFFRDFKPSVPRKAKGGIKAQQSRGAFAESWWAKRWIAALESFHIGARLGRGRSYARSGQVLSIDIEKGKVKAKVQGSRPKPYEVTIRIKTLSASDWQKLTKSLSRQALFLAKLLGGQMPGEIERVFNTAGLSLFPDELKDLQTDCSCPDWSNPCKHIAAVYYLLGEEFDRDPFLIFKMRGMSREELLKLLGSAGGKKGRRKNIRTLTVPDDTKDQVSRPGALPSDSSKFWGEGGLPDNFFKEVQIPPVPAALLKRLGSFPFWRGQVRFLDALEPVYIQASMLGMDVFLGEKGLNPVPRSFPESGD
jgi:uncharacterized Zn finger protein